jgi:hypothetical protein
VRVCDIKMTVFPYQEDDDDELRGGDIGSNRISIDGLNMEYLSH